MVLMPSQMHSVRCATHACIWRCGQHSLLWFFFPLLSAMCEYLQNRGPCRIRRHAAALVAGARATTVSLHPHWVDYSICTRAQLCALPTSWCAACAFAASCPQISSSVSSWCASNIMFVLELIVSPQLHAATGFCKSQAC